MNKATHRTKKDDHSVTPDPARPPSVAPRAPVKRDENRRQKTDALSRAALFLFLERGIEAVSIDDITRAASASKGSFYRYFASKEALVEALVFPVFTDIEHAIKRCEERLSEASDRSSLYSSYQELALALVPIALHRLDVVRLYLQESRAPSAGARGPLVAMAVLIDNGAIHLTTVAVERGLLQVDDPRISALAVVGAIERLAFSVLTGRLDASPVDIVSGLIRLVLDGVAKPR
jgi:AcrR family transcriptional regulator